MYSMKFTFAHNNLNVLDLDKSLAFYKEALDLTEAVSYTHLDVYKRQNKYITKIFKYKT